MERSTVELTIGFRRYRLEDDSVVFSHCVFGVLEKTARIPIELLSDRLPVVKPNVQQQREAMQWLIALALFACISYRFFEFDVLSWFLFIVAIVVAFGYLRLKMRESIFSFFYVDGELAFSFSARKDFTTDEFCRQLLNASQKGAKVSQTSSRKRECEVGTYSWRGVWDSEQCRLTEREIVMRSRNWILRKELEVPLHELEPRCASFRYRRWTFVSSCLSAIIFVSLGLALSNHIVNSLVLSICFLFFLFGASAFIFAYFQYPLVDSYVFHKRRGGRIIGIYGLGKYRSECGTFASNISDSIKNSILRS